jgi:hypothetical protein
MFKRRSSTTFYCFSPPVMIATFVIEISLALYTIFRYRLTPLSRLVVMTLYCLALFQLSEYFVCGGFGVDALQWSRIGYVAITLLPPLGLHILYVLVKKPERRLVYAAYASAVAFSAYFLFHDQAFSGHVCAGNYVIFQLTTLATWLYAAFYYGWLLTAVGLGMRWYLRQREAFRRKGIAGLIVGYAVFIVPTGIAVVLNPAVMSGIPSVMCGFAVIFALILAFYIMPVVDGGERKPAKRTKRS